MLHSLPDGDTTRPIAELLDGLDRVFDFGGEPDLDPAKHRARYINALRLFGTFLDQVTSRDFSGHLLHLATALHDLDSGTVHSLLTPVPSRPLYGSEIWVARAQAAIAIEILLRSGLKRAALKNILSKRIPMLSALADGSDDPAEAAMAWHKNFLAGKIKNRLAAEVFARKWGELNTQPKNATPTQMRDVAARLLDVSPDLLTGI